MKLVILYRPNSEHARAAETFVHDFSQRYPDIKVEMMDVDSREGSAQASLYDLMRHPAILALAGDGVLLKSWEGEEMPLMDEVASYSYSM